MRTLALLLLMALLAGLLASQWHGDRSASGGRLSASARIAGRAIVIRNEGRETISDCYLTVNSRFKRGGLSFAPQETGTIPAASLMTGNDVRLDLGVDQIDRLHLQCFAPQNADASFELQ